MKAVNIFLKTDKINDKLSTFKVGFNPHWRFL